MRKFCLIALHISVKLITGVDYNMKLLTMMVLAVGLHAATVTSNQGVMTYDGHGDNKNIAEYGLFTFDKLANPAVVDLTDLTGFTGELTMQSVALTTMGSYEFNLDLDNVKAFHLDIGSDVLTAEIDWNGNSLKTFADPQGYFGYGPNVGAALGTMGTVDPAFLFKDTSAPVAEPKFALAIGFLTVLLWSSLRKRTRTGLTA